MSRSLAALACAAVLVVPGTARGQSTPSSFAQLTGTRGCLVADGFENPSLAGCGRAPGLADLARVVVGPGDKQVYVVGAGSDIDGTNGVTVFARDPADRALTFASCVTNDGGDGRAGSAGVCRDGDALRDALGLALSPDGAFAYVSSAVPGGVAWLARDPATGALTPAGCLRSDPVRRRCRRR